MTFPTIYKIQNIRNNERFHVSYARTVFRKYFMEFLVLEYSIQIL